MKVTTLLYKKIIFLLKKKINIDIDKLNSNDLNDLFSYFGTDKANNVKNPYNLDSENEFGHGYAKFYEKHLSSLKYKNFNNKIYHSPKI